MESPQFPEHHRGVSVTPDESRIYAIASSKKPSVLLFRRECHFYRGVLFAVARQMRLIGPSPAGGLGSPATVSGFQRRTLGAMSQGIARSLSVPAAHEVGA